MSSTPAPDLASVLSILASLTPTPTSQKQQQQLSRNPSHPSSTAPAPQLPPQQPYGQAPQLPYECQPPAPRSTTPTEPPPNVKLVDPATITEWSAGLRCVMKTVAKHEGMLLEIRRMIKTQHEHEELWFRSREALIEKQAARKEGQRKLDDVLKLVGGSVSEGMSSNASPEEMKKELETFDMKVHRAQTQMVREMMAALKRLGVPFFGTRVDLVRIPAKAGPGEGEREDGQGVIDEAQLINLQRRMLVILEDLCSD